MFCDHGADISHTSISGMSPLVYAATKGYDDICMYLSLRTENVDTEDQQSGKNVFFIYLEKKDIIRMKQLLMRGADINYCNKKQGFTALHFAIENRFPVKVVRFLLKSKANPHIEDLNGQDCCDKAQNIVKYKDVAKLTKYECQHNPGLRVKPRGAQFNS